MGNKSSSSSSSASSSSSSSSSASSVHKSSSEQQHEYALHLYSNIREKARIHRMGMNDEKNMKRQVRRIIFYLTTQKNHQHMTLNQSMQELITAAGKVEEIILPIDSVYPGSVPLLQWMVGYMLRRHNLSCCIRQRSRDAYTIEELMQLGSAEQTHELEKENTSGQLTAYEFNEMLKCWTENLKMYKERYTTSSSPFTLSCLSIILHDLMKLPYDCPNSRSWLPAVDDLVKVLLEMSFVTLKPAADTWRATASASGFLASPHSSPHPSTSLTTLLPTFLITNRPHLHLTHLPLILTLLQVMNKLTGTNGMGKELFISTFVIAGNWEYDSIELMFHFLLTQSNYQRFIQPSMFDGESKEDEPVQQEEQGQQSQQPHNDPNVLKQHSSCWKIIEEVFQAIRDETTAAPSTTTGVHFPPFHEYLRKQIPLLPHRLLSARLRHVLFTPYLLSEQDIKNGYGGGVHYELTEQEKIQQHQTVTELIDAMKSQDPLVQIDLNDMNSSGLSLLFVILLLPKHEFLRLAECESEFFVSIRRVTLRTFGCRYLKYHILDLLFCLHRPSRPTQENDFISNLWTCMIQHFTSLVRSDPTSTNASVYWSLWSYIQLLDIHPSIQFRGHTQTDVKVPTKSMVWCWNVLKENGVYGSGATMEKYESEVVDGVTTSSSSAYNSNPSAFTDFYSLLFSSFGPDHLREWLHHYANTTDGIWPERRGPMSGVSLLEEATQIVERYVKPRGLVMGQEGRESKVAKQVLLENVVEKWQTEKRQSIKEELNTWMIHDLTEIVVDYLIGSVRVETTKAMAMAPDSMDEDS